MAIAFINTARRSVTESRPRRWIAQRHITLVGKCALITAGEVLANAILWIIAALILRRVNINDGNRALSLGLVAWTTGLRHGLDADHICAIDNATRRIVSIPSISKDGSIAQIRRPVTVGLFFSLGHSMVVFATTVAVAISASAANHLDKFGNVGGIIGSSVSSSFLILIACINTVISYKTWKRYKTAKQAKKQGLSGQEQQREVQFKSFLTRFAMPILRSVDRPWKLFPVGFLFGLGFDTASSIALLCIAVITSDTPNSQPSQKNAKVVLLALLFTAGMTLVDSINSCLMIWAYAPDTNMGKGVRKLALYRKKQPVQQQDLDTEERRLPNSDDDESIPVAVLTSAAAIDGSPPEIGAHLEPSPPLRQQEDDEEDGKPYSRKQGIDKDDDQDEALKNGWYFANEALSQDDVGANKRERSSQLEIQPRDDSTSQIESSAKRKERFSQLEAGPKTSTETDLEKNEFVQQDLTPNEDAAPQQEGQRLSSRTFDHVSHDVSASLISLLLTILSICVAFIIGIIVLLGMIGEVCGSCKQAADEQEVYGDGGLSGRWWYTWRKANDNSGYVGAAIVGAFLVCVVGYHGIRWAIRRSQRPTEKSSNDDKDADDIAATEQA